MNDQKTYVCTNTKPLLLKPGVCQDYAGFCFVAWLSKVCRYQSVCAASSDHQKSPSCGDLLLYSSYKVQYSCILNLAFLY